MTNEDLSDLPGFLKAELIRLRAERDVFVEERKELRGQLATSRTKLSQIEKKYAEECREDLDTAYKQAKTTINTLTDEITALGIDISTARAERDALRTELFATRENRDKLRLLLLENELENENLLAPTNRNRATPHHAPQNVNAENNIAELNRQITHLTNELSATHQTVSWRITAPLRAIRRKTTR